MKVLGTVTCFKCWRFVSASSTSNWQLCLTRLLKLQRLRSTEMRRVIDGRYPNSSASISFLLNLIPSTSPSCHSIKSYTVCMVAALSFEISASQGKNKKIDHIKFGDGSWIIWSPLFITLRVFLPIIHCSFKLRIGYSLFIIALGCCFIYYSADMLVLFVIPDFPNPNIHYSFFI